MNYEPHEFEVLYQIINRFLEKGTTIILSTPQRLMAKAFIQQLLPWCAIHQQMDVSQAAEKTAVTILVLKGK